MIVAVTDEPKSKIDEFIKKHGCTYTFITAREALKNYGIKAFPTMFTVDAHGKVSGSDPVSLLGDCDVAPARDYSKKFDKALASIKSGDFKAAALALAKLAKGTGADADNAKALGDWIESHGGKRIAEGDAVLADGDVISARDAYLEVSKHWDPKGDSGKSAKDKLSTLQKDKDCKKALSQEKTFQQAVAAADGGDNATAAALYEKCAKAAAGTKFAEFCTKQAQSLK